MAPCPPPVPTYTYAPPPGQILATCLARSTMECVVRSILKTRSRHPSWVATPGGGEDRYPRVLDFSSSPSRRAVAPPPLIPIPVVNGGLQRFRSFFGQFRGGRFLLREGAQGYNQVYWYRYGIWVWLVFYIGMQTHICSPNGGQMERDIRAIPPTGKSPGPTYLYNSGRDHVSGPGGPHV